MILSYLSEFRLTKLMLILELAGNATKMNVSFRKVKILQLFQNHLIINLATMKSKKF